MSRKFIGFTGNREGLSDDQKTKIKEILDKCETDITVLHGDCVGADTDFHNLCINYKQRNPDKNLTIHIYPPNNKTMRAFNVGDLIMNEEPYLVRNDNILKNSHYLIACPIDKNIEILRSGTWSTIRKARKQNKIIYIL
jgi:hypothetical protein